MDVSVDVGPASSYPSVRLYIGGGFEAKSGCEFDHSLRADVAGLPFWVESHGRAGPDGCTPAVLAYGNGAPEYRLEPWDRTPPGLIWDRVVVGDSSMEISFDALELISSWSWGVGGAPDAFRGGERAWARISPGGLFDFEAIPFEINFAGGLDPGTGYHVRPEQIWVIHRERGFELFDQLMYFDFPQGVPVGTTGYFRLSVPEVPLRIENCKNAVCSGAIHLHLSDSLRKEVVP